MTPTTLDILYLTLSLSVILLTVFLVWAIFYVVQILRSTNKTVEHVRDRIRKIEEAFLIGIKMAKTVKDFVRDQKSRKRS